MNVFFILFLSFSANAKTLKLPEVSAEYVCNTKFIIGANVLETRTFRTKNKKRIDTVIKNVPQSVIIDYEKQTASWVWPKTSSYLSVPLIKENQENIIDEQDKEIKSSGLSNIFPVSGSFSPLLINAHCDIDFNFLEALKVFSLSLIHI